MGTLPAAPTEGGGAKLHFLVTDGDAAATQVAVEAADNNDTNSVGWAGVATHVEGDTLTVPGDVNTAAAPLVLIGGDKSGSAAPLQVDGNESLKVVLQAAAATAIGTVALSAVDNAVLDTIDAVLDQIKIDTQAIQDAVEGSLSVDGATITVAAHAVTNAGTFVTQIDGAALTALQLIDDAVYVDDGDWTNTTSKHLLVGGLYQSGPQTVTDGDVAPFNITVNGAIHAALQASTAEIGKLAAGIAEIGNVKNSGTFVTQIDGAALTALQLIDNIVQAEDAVHSSTDSGVMSLSVRNDAGTALSADGDYSPLTVNSSGALYVTGGGGGTEYTVNVAVPSDPTGTASLMERDDSLSTLTEVEADWTNMRSNDQGALWVTVNGSVTANPASGTIDTVTNVATIGTSVTPGTSAAHLGKAIQSAQGATDTGVGALAVRNDALADLAGADGDYTPLQVNAAGALYVDIRENSNPITVDAASTSFGAAIEGDVDHDSVDANAPAKIGGRAQSPEAAADEVADNDRTDALFDREGMQAVRGPFNPKYAAINTSTSGNNTIVAADATHRIAVWAILLVSDGTTDVRWEDGANGASGTFTGQVPLQAREGYTISAGGLVPLFVGTGNVLLNLELTAAVLVHGFVSYTLLPD